MPVHEVFAGQSAGHSPARKEDHDRADVARASASATRGRVIQSRGRSSTRVSAAASRSRGRLLFSTDRVPRSSSRPVFPMLPHPVLDRAPGDETSQSPPRETDFVIEPMEVDESDGEDQGVVFPMDTHVVDLNWDNGPSENSEYWLGSRSFQRLNPRHILEHSGSPNRYSSPIADPFDDASTTDDFYFTMAEAESAENSQQLVLASLDMTKVIVVYTVRSSIRSF